MSSITRSIEEMVDANPGIDNQQAFDDLWALNNELFAKVKARFELAQDPCCSDLQPYKGTDGAQGHIGAYTGPEIDWLIHSWTGNPKASFTNIHLTISLGPHIDVPHFGFALGTTPDFFWYMDYMPRLDLAANPQYAEKYYGAEVNDNFIDFQRDDNFSAFVSRDLYTRVAQTPCSLCYGAPINDSNLETIRQKSHQQLDRWLAWVDAAEPVPESDRAALAARDLKIRRTICEKDPANVVAEKLFGKELTQQLVDTLSSTARHSKPLG